MTARLRLRRSDGRIFLDRWGVEHPRVGGIFLHRIGAPDPGEDLHDHPWSFVSLVLWGEYVEQRSNVRIAPISARLAERHPLTCLRGVVGRRRWLSVRRMRLDECHTITGVTGAPTWTLVLHGRPVRPWGFYTADGWISHRHYDATRNRPLHEEIVR